MAEFTDEESKVLLGSKKLLDQLLANPKTMVETQRLIKAVHPDVKTIEDNPIMEEVRGLAKRFDDDRRERRDRELDEKLDGEFSLLRDDGWQPEGLEKLKQFMLDEGIRSPLNAAAAYDRKNPVAPQAPSILAPNSWQFGADSTNADMKRLFTNEDAWAEEETGRVLAEFRAADRIRT
jgi:hypothetical protein